MAELVGPILDVFKFIGSKASKYLKYQREFAEYVGNFKQAQADLRAKEAGIQQQLEDEHHFGKKPKQEVEGWIKKVEEKLAHAQHVEDKVSKGKYLFRSCLGKLVDESIQAMKEVHAEGHFPGSLLVNDPSTIAVNLPTTELVGTANVRDEIYQYLMGDDVGMIGVWGMGGIGKTTTMKDVHNRLLKERKFRKLIWVTVPKDLDIPRLQKNIASQLERNLSDDEDIIIRAGKMKLVVRECDGLPLAIVTLAGCMRGVIDPRVWENAVDELRGYIRNICNMEDKVHGCLKFSYERLKQRDRECFLYCALYPEDYKIGKNELIEHWMEEGLIDEMESRKSMESSGYSILQNLEENCLLERGERDYKNSVHMHDVVRDMALHITWKRFMVKARMQLKELPNGEEWSEDLEKISLMDNFISIIPQTMKFPKFPKLTTLLLSLNSLKEIPESFFEHFPNLKILDLSYNPFKSLPNSISSLEKLEVLLLNYCYELESFPSVLKLQALKKLNLRSTAINKIPQGLEMLVNLRYLNLGCTRRLKEIPTGLLSKLCRLQYLVIHSKLKNTEEVRELNKLEFFEGWFSNVGDLSTFAAQRKMLYAYSILVCPRNNDMFYTVVLNSMKLVKFDGIEINSGDAVVLPYDIGQLHLRWCKGVRSLNDIGLRDATDLKKIVVETCNELEAVFSSKCHLLQTLESLILEHLLNLNVIVGAADWVLQNLENLNVSNCSKLEEIIAEPEGEGMGTNNDSIKFNFPKLRTLILSNLPKLKGICSENAVMVCNSLQAIEIDYCLKVKRIPLYLPQLESPSNTLQEICVYPTNWWESVEWKHPILNVKNVVQPFLKFRNRYEDWFGTRLERTRYEYKYY
ncbi:hypothetical protein GOBAR_AA12351 [Gossypium barbadense]|uniref:Uncharacterized protein n=1 Tax=Gossypium barbadense TaxID=3634 RepID=A0A2P5XYA0_GOSBA|nr:hypothetical protein GOBAR_AA12351 [Gossypium barbadense]